MSENNKVAVPRRQLQLILRLRLLWKVHFQNGLQKTMKNQVAGFSLKLI
jgi:hypothetical protein